jgi:hypothetical protein
MSVPTRLTCFSSAVPRSHQDRSWPSGSDGEWDGRGSCLGRKLLRDGKDLNCLVCTELLIWLSLRPCGIRVVPFGFPLGSKSDIAPEVTGCN